MAVQARHAFSRWTYEKTADGLVLVTDPVSEGSGLFNPDGTWVSGEITSADIMMIRYVGGKHAQRDPNRPDPGTRFAGRQKG